ncbi:MAG: A/G-specific adenine glycosylase [Eubacteriales bacterium]|nr:A/G-specific adenine glycosylase [Eubacteriales bacterium]
MTDHDLLLEWYARVKRDLPWRQTHDPYRIWISEIMLQQTRVETVKDYYRRFLERFPDVAALASAPQEDVLKLWEGLGYYSRARNLQKAARTIMEERNGVFPSTYSDLLTLSGIGPYTAGAIASIAFGEAVPAVDGNVQRVCSRFFGIRENIAVPSVQRALREKAALLLQGSDPGSFNQAMMELGATVCLSGNPKCALCPWAGRCDAFQEGDAQRLPVHEKKPAPKEVDMAVCLLTFEGRVAVFQRTERMLHGLYVFDLLEDETQPDSVLRLLERQGFAARSLEPLGEAKHVFTHRVWNMTIYHATLACSCDSVSFVNREELLALPLPTAMKAAKEKALTLLG